MSNRERTLAIVLIGLIVLAVGGFAGYLLVYEPIRQMSAAADKLEGDVLDLAAKKKMHEEGRKRLAVAKKRSLPADENLARHEYNEMMAQLVRQAGIPLGYTISPKSAPANDRTIPTLPGANKRPAYTKVVTQVTFKKADMWAVHDFLQGYYRLNLLQQITHLEIKKDDEQGTPGRTRTAPDRKDLTVTLTTEALIIDGAEPRRTLLPVPTGFAAVGGWAGFDTIALRPEIGRGINPLVFQPVLATRPRDYTLIVQKDPFHGPYPAPENLSLGKPAEVAVTVGEDIPAVAVPVKGEPAFTGKVTLTATSDNPKLLPPSGLKIDQTKRTLTPVPTKDATGSANVTIVAKAENGQEAKTEFRVKVNEKVEEVKPSPPDISPAVLLTGVTPRSDGTTFAVIRDNATPFKYEIEATPQGVTVVKYYYLNGQKRKDYDYETPNLLVISDGTQGAEKATPLRTLRVVALDDTGLIVQDMKPEPKAAPKVPGGRGPGGRGPAAPPKAAPRPVDAPLAAVVGLAAGAADRTVVLYRWETGKALSSLKQIPADEARTILQRAEATGPIGIAPYVGSDIATPRPVAGN